MRKIHLAAILTSLIFNSCGGGGETSSSPVPPVHAAGPPSFSGTYSFSLTSFNVNNTGTGNTLPMTGVLTATPPATAGGQGNVSGELFAAQGTTLFAAQGTTFCSNTFTGTFQVDTNNGIATGILTFSTAFGSASCYTSGNTSFAASPGASASSGGPGSRVFLSVGSLNIPAASGEAVLQ